MGLSAACMPPSAIMVLASPMRSFVTMSTFAPALCASIAAEEPAPLEEALLDGVSDAVLPPEEAEAPEAEPSDEALLADELSAAALLPVETGEPKEEMTDEVPDAALLSVEGEGPEEALPEKVAAAALLPVETEAPEAAAPARRSVTAVRQRPRPRFVWGTWP